MTITREYPHPDWVLWACLQEIINDTDDSHNKEEFIRNLINQDQDILNNCLHRRSTRQGEGARQDANDNGEYTRLEVNTLDSNNSLKFLFRKFLFQNDLLPSEELNNSEAYQRDLMERQMERSVRRGNATIDYIKPWIEYEEVDPYIIKPMPKLKFKKASELFSS